MWVWTNLINVFDFKIPKRLELKPFVHIFADDLNFRLDERERLIQDTFVQRCELYVSLAHTARSNAPSSNKSNPREIPPGSAAISRIESFGFESGCRQSQERPGTAQAIADVRARWADQGR